MIISNFKEQDQLKWLIPAVPYVATTIHIDETLFGLVLAKVKNYIEENRSELLVTANQLDFLLTDKELLTDQEMENIKMIYDDYFHQYITSFSANYKFCDFSFKDIDEILQYIRERLYSLL